MIEALDPQNPDVSEVPLSGDVRVDIANSLLNVLALSDEQLTENQRTFTGDMLTAMVPFLSQEYLLDMSTQLSQRRSLAPSLARVLILQPIEIARPLIEKISELPDGLLIEAMAVSQDHQRSVAGRFRVSESVADALFETGTPALRVSCLMREDVPLAAHRVAALIELSKTEVSVRMPLLNRKELQPSHGFTMFWWMNTAQRSRVLARFNLSREPIQDMLAPLYVSVFTDPKSDPVARGVLSLCDRRHRPRNSAGQVVSMPTVEQMMRALRAKPSDSYCSTAALLAGVSARTMRKLVDDVGGEPFAVLCKSLGISRGKFADILQAADPSNPGVEGPTFDEERREELHATFDTIARDYARTILRYWDWHDAMADLQKADETAADGPVT